MRVRSAAPDRLTYLQRPDLGRRLDPADRAHLPVGEWDVVVFVVADGLSSRAVHEHGAAMVRATTALLPTAWRVGPVVLAEQARVALGDDVASAMGAVMVVVFVGERPGMSAADSLGAYLTYRPVPGVTTDASRNCLSNIRPPSGMAYEVAAGKLAGLMGRARELGVTGVGLKDDADVGWGCPGEAGPGWAGSAGCPGSAGGCGGVGHRVCPNGRSARAG